MQIFIRAESLYSFGKNWFFGGFFDSLFMVSDIGLFAGLCVVLKKPYFVNYEETMKRPPKIHQLPENQQKTIFAKPSSIVTFE